jgi:hypothetical protein
MIRRLNNPPPAAAPERSQADAIAAARRARRAAKQREYRERKAAGLFCVKIEIGGDVVAALIRLGLVKQQDANEPAVLAFVLGDLIEKFVTRNAGAD